MTTAAATPQVDKPNIQPDEPICANHDHTVPRRKFLRGVLAIGAGVAGLLGSSVKFAPTAVAAPTCLNTPKTTWCYPGFFPCIGLCSTTQSCCQYGSSGRPDTLVCCQCWIQCVPARVSVYQVGKNCYYCCVGC